VVISGHVTNMGHTIRSAIAEPHVTRKLHGSMCYRNAVIADRSFTLRE